MGGGEGGRGHEWEGMNGDMGGVWMEGAWEGAILEGGVWVMGEVWPARAILIGPASRECEKGRKEVTGCAVGWTKMHGGPSLEAGMPTWECGEMVAALGGDGGSPRGSRHRVGGDVLLLAVRLVAARRGGVG